MCLSVSGSSHLACPAGAFVWDVEEFPLKADCHCMCESHVTCASIHRQTLSPSRLLCTVQAPPRRGFRFLQTHTQKWDRWVLRQFCVQPLEDPPYCFPHRRHQAAVAPPGHEGSLFPTP